MLCVSLVMLLSPRKYRLECDIQKFRENGRSSVTWIKLNSCITWYMWYRDDRHVTVTRAASDQCSATIANDCTSTIRSIPRATWQNSKKGLEKNECACSIEPEGPGVFVVLLELSDSTASPRDIWSQGLRLLRLACLTLMKLLLSRKSESAASMNLRTVAWAAPLRRAAGRPGPGPYRDRHGDRHGGGDSPRPACPVTNRAHCQRDKRRQSNLNTCTCFHHASLGHGGSVMTATYY